MMPDHFLPRTLLCTILLAAATFSYAEKADRRKPVNLEADRVTVDEVNKVHLFDGRVTLSQGTLAIRADKLVVRQDAEGFQNGIATGIPGNPARFRVKREGKEEFVEGEAERIEYDARSEVTKFFNHAVVRSGLDEVRGQYIVFDGQNEQYSVTSGPDGSVVPGRDNRVRAVIQPKSQAADAAAPGQPAQLQIAPTIRNPGQEQ